MQMAIKSLEIENFKGINRFEFVPGKTLTAISAKNGVGKTSIYDSFLWLLFGTNSAGESKFEIRPKNAPNEIEPTVTATIEVDGKETEFKKVYSSKFSKETGEFKEYKTECYINGVKKGVREFEKLISEIVSTQHFRLLTNPRYFSEELEWQERRELLFDLAKIQSETDIANADENFKVLVPYIEKYGEINEYKKFLKGEDKSLTEQLNKIKTRIDEVYRTIDTTVNLEFEEQTRADTLENLETLKTKLKNLESNSEIENLSEKKKQLKLKLETLIIENDAHHFKTKKARTAEIEKEENELKLYADKLNLEISENAKKIKSFLKNIENLKSQRETAVSICKAESERHISDTCPTCNRVFPLDKLAEIEEKHKSAVQKLRQDISGIDIAIAESKKSVSEFIEKNEELIKELENTTSKINSLRAKKGKIVVSDFVGFEEQRQKLETEIAEIDNKIATCNTSNDDEIKKIKAEIEILNIDIANSDNRITIAKMNKNAENRIEELRKEQREIAVKKAEIQKYSDIVKEFIKRKISLTEQSINSKFKFVKFKLFTQNVTNDDINECCEAIAFNSPSYKNLSYSQKIIVGLDIISAFSTANEMSIPMFLDNLDSFDSENRKSVLSMTNAQKIALVVSNNPTLTVEVTE